MRDKEDLTYSLRYAHYNDDSLVMDAGPGDVIFWPADYGREWRDSPEKLATLPVQTMTGQQITLGTVAKISLSEGPPMLKSDNARPTGYVYVDVQGRDLTPGSSRTSRATAARRSATTELRSRPCTST